MARQRQYADPISIPFTFERKEQIAQLSSEYPIAQADVIRWCVDEALSSVSRKIREGLLA